MEDEAFSSSRTVSVCVLSARRLSRCGELSWSAPSSARLRPLGPLRIRGARSTRVRLRWLSTTVSVVPCFSISVGAYLINILSIVSGVPAFCISLGAYWSCSLSTVTSVPMLTICLCVLDEPFVHRLPRAVPLPHSCAGTPLQQAPP